MLGTKDMEKVIKKETKKALSKFGLAQADQTFDLEVFLKAQKKKAKYFVFVTNGQKGLGNLRIAFSLRKSTAKTVKKGVVGTLKEILGEAHKAWGAKNTTLDQKQVKKYFKKKRYKKILKALKK